MYIAAYQYTVSVMSLTTSSNNNNVNANNPLLGMQKPEVIECEICQIYIAHNISCIIFDMDVIGKKIFMASLVSI
jgi:hypothetical protein